MELETSSEKNYLPLFTWGGVQKGDAVATRAQSLIFSLLSWFFWYFFSWFFFHWWFNKYNGKKWQFMNLNVNNDSLLYSNITTSHKYILVTGNNIERHYDVMRTKINLQHRPKPIKSHGVLSRVHFAVS